MATFEGRGRGSNFTQNASNMNRKAIELHELVERIAQEVLDIDEQIQVLAAKGIKGSAMSQAMNTYVTNREVIDDFVKRFAATACALSDSSIAASNVNESAEGSASGVV